MSFNNKKATLGTYLVYLEADSATMDQHQLDKIAYTISTGTSGHGITVSNGVISLPAGEWICYASVEAVDITTAVEIRWYVNNVGNTDFTDIIHNDWDSEIRGTYGFYTDMYTSAITLEGGVDVDLRIIDSNKLNPTIGKSDMVIYGVRT